MLAIYSANWSIEIQQVAKQNRLLLARHMVEVHGLTEEVAERRIRDDYSHLKLDDPR